MSNFNAIVVKMILRRTQSFMVRQQHEQSRVSPRSNTQSMHSDSDDIVVWRPSTAIWDTAADGTTAKTGARTHARMGRKSNPFLGLGNFLRGERMYTFLWRKRPGLSFLSNISWILLFIYRRERCNLSMDWFELPFKRLVRNTHFSALGSEIPYGACVRIWMPAIRTCVEETYWNHRRYPERCMERCCGMHCHASCNAYANYFLVDAEEVWKHLVIRQDWACALFS